MTISKMDEPPMRRDQDSKTFEDHGLKSLGAEGFAIAAVAAMSNAAADTPD